MEDTLIIIRKDYEHDFSSLCNVETKYSIFVQRKDTTQVYTIILLYNFLLVYTKNTYNQRGSKQRCLHNYQLTKANAYNKTTHNALRNEQLLA